VGVRNAILSLHRRPVSADQRGTLFEQWLTLQVMYLNRTLRKDWRLYSYRTEAGAEVDLVVERESGLVGIKIKASRNVGRSDLRGLASLAEFAGRCKPLKKWIAYLGESAQILEEGVRAWPYLELLAELGRGS
jgi:predicted AAA+ superfamily ATPase